ncbi:MAG: hypothetical protein ACOX7Q_16370 [Kiritimatiellia bacterium]
MILNRKMKSLISDIWPGWDRTWLIPAGTNAFPLTVFNGVALPGVYTIALAGPSNVVARYGGVTVRGGESNAVAFPPGSTLETVLVQAFDLPVSIKCTQRRNAALLPGGSGQAACEREPLGGQEEREPEDEKRTEPHRLI